MKCPVCSHEMQNGICPVCSSAGVRSDENKESQAASEKADARQPQSSQNTSSASGSVSDSATPPLPESSVTEASSASDTPPVHSSDSSHSETGTSSQSSASASRTGQSASTDNDVYFESFSRFTPEAGPASAWASRRNLLEEEIPETLPARYRPISMWGYFGYQVLFSIPVIGWVFLILFAFGKTDNINLQNFARSYFCMLILLIAVFLVCAAVLYAAVGSGILFMR